MPTANEVEEAETAYNRARAKLRQTKSRLLRDTTVTDPVAKAAAVQSLNDQLDRLEKSSFIKHFLLGKTLQTEAQDAYKND